MEKRGPGGGCGLSITHDRAMGAFDGLCGQDGVDGAPPERFGWAAIAGTHARFATSGKNSAMQAALDKVRGHWQRGGYSRLPGPALQCDPPELDGLTGEGGQETCVPFEVRARQRAASLPERPEGGA